MCLKISHFTQKIVKIENSSKNNIGLCDIHSNNFLESKIKAYAICNHQRMSETTSSLCIMKKNVFVSISQLLNVKKIQ